MYSRTSKVIEKILSNYGKLTKLEKEIGNFFIENEKTMDFSSKNISEKKFVSPASLSRFAQKCGFKGYRDFVYQYERYISTKFQYSDFDGLTKNVLGVYQDLLEMSIKRVDEEQMNRIVKYMLEAGMLLMFGMGSSGIVTEELKLRLSRIGLPVEIAQDAHRIKIYTSLLGNEDLVMGISLSGETLEVLEGLKLAKKKGAKTILFTANSARKEDPAYDEVVLLASVSKLDCGMGISPQNPILFIFDILFAYCLHRNIKENELMYAKTLAALNEKS